MKYNIGIAVNYDNEELHVFNNAHGHDDGRDYEPIMVIDLNEPGNEDLKLRAFNVEHKGLIEAVSEKYEDLLDQHGVAQMVKCKVQVTTEVELPYLEGELVEFVVSELVYDHICDTGLDENQVVVLSIED